MGTVSWHLVLTQKMITKLCKKIHKLRDLIHDHKETKWKHIDAMTQETQRVANQPK